MKSVVAGVLAASLGLGETPQTDPFEEESLSSLPNSLQTEQKIWDFNDCLHEMLGREGGLNSDPRDPGNKGGAQTNQGVTQAAYNEYRTLHKLEIQEVRSISIEEVAGLYRELYWDRAHCNEVADPALRLLLFDTAVNCGPSKSIELLQHALGGLKEDGVWGPNTQAAVEGILDPNSVRANYLEARVAHYNHLVEINPALSVYLVGWLNRVEHYRELIEDIPIFGAGDLGTIPFPEEPNSGSSAPMALESYLVQSGDSLWNISERLLGKGTRWQEIAKLNGIDLENPTIWEGQELKIPSERAQ